jgi:HSP20 family protein
MNRIKVKNNSRDLFRDVFSPMIFSDFFSPMSGGHSDFHSDVSEADFRPFSNISETDEELNVVISLAGYDKKDVSIDIKNGILTVSGGMEEMESKEGEKFFRREIRTGKFSISVKVGEKVDSSKAVAKMDAGLLTITFPKLKSELPRKIEVK